MCGIAGFMTADGAPAPSAVLNSLLTALAHRGPDGEGRYAAAGIGLVQSRLAIIDLVTGDQPLYGPNGSVVICNGEIYNYVELREDFPGANFQTSSDCEPLLWLYDRDKAVFARSLRGMYAIALYDPTEATLFLARDPFGIKPLYYAETAQGLIFASEPQAILNTGLIPRRARTEAISELMQLQFTTGRETIFAGIKRVLPGETLEVRRGKVVGRHRITAVPEGEPERISEADALARLDAAMMDSVKVHQRSDVPYGMFLSGGIDSSALLACMAELNETPVRAYTAGFPGADASDEREHARRVAQALGADHVEVAVTGDVFWSRLPAVVAAIDDPAADYAVVPTYLLAERAAKELKVVLCGEGGDELFAGYGRYRSVLRSFWLGGRTMRSKGLMDGLGLLRDPGAAWRDGIVAVERRLADTAGTRLQKAQALDCADWLPNDLLIKLDRCLMAHALEGRTPLLDPLVAAASFRLPDELKIRNGLGKHLLRRWLDRKLPAASAFDRKRGFTVPVGEWMAPRAAAVGPWVAKVEGVRSCCNPERVEQLFKTAARSRDKHTMTACWLLLFYALWHRIHIEGKPHAGDVMDTLKAA
jgi:asparagine synthase (glutamine-hydrolysing)